MFICNALPSAAGLDTGLPGAQVSSLPGAACPESQETSPWCCLEVLLTHRWFPWGRHFWDAGHTEACGHTHTHTHTRARDSWEDCWGRRAVWGRTDVTLLSSSPRNTTLRRPMGCCTWSSEAHPRGTALPS